MRTFHSAFALLLVIAAGQVMAAEQPPIGIDAFVLEETPYVFDTAEQHEIEVTLLARGLPRAFSLAFLPDGDLLVSERGGNLRVIHDATGPAAMLDPGRRGPGAFPLRRNRGARQATGK